MKGLITFFVFSAVAARGLALPLESRDTVDILNANANWTPPPDKRDTVDILNANANWTPPPDKI